MADDTIKILGFAGSMRQGSYNRMLLNAAAELLPSNTTMDIYDFGEMPIFDQDSEKKTLSAEVTKFKEKVRQADAILISTPEYNYTIPAALKNVLEWASRPYGDNAFDRKPVAVMSASTEGGGGAIAQYHLRQIMVYLNAYVLNKPQVLVNFADEKFDAKGALTDSDARTHLKVMLTNLQNWARLIKYGKANNLI
ncbi:FMN-dependent NADH-azoreductase [uncultured archaeon]|nr:FMN-dependent NADH-azoreductase [uncultured archaeon]